MAWNVLFYETEGEKKPVARFLRGLSVQARAKCSKYISMLAEHGFSLPGQYLEKVRGDLWALRPEYGGNEYRIIFFHDSALAAFIVVHAILKNTRRIDGNDIDTAESRLADWLARKREKETT
jgi:phage-related protein